MLEDSSHNWFRGSPLKTVLELGVTQQMLSFKGLAAHFQRGQILTNTVSVLIIEETFAVF